jgi:hypothetical protein
MSQTNAVEKKNTPFCFRQRFSENRGVYGIMGKNKAESARPEITTWPTAQHAQGTMDNNGYRHKLRICNTSCFMLQQWLGERTSMLQYTHTARLSIEKLLTYLLTHSMEQSPS